MARIKAIAIDLDNTLLNAEKEIDPLNLSAVRRADAAGCHIILATARPIGSVAQYSRQLGLSKPIICDNGARVYGSPEGPVWRAISIPIDVAEHLCRQADQSGWEISTLVGDTNYLKQRPGQALGPIPSRPGFEIVAVNADALKKGDPVRMFTWDEPAIIELDRICREAYPTRSRSDIFYKADGSLNSLGIVGPGADKGSALGLVLARLGLTPAEAIAIGDNSNDVSMLELAGIGVAMGNATAELKAIADWVAPKHTEGGVAHTLERFVLSMDK